jgi:hypothetical protein
VALSDHPMRLRRPNGTTISRSGSSGKSAKRKPRPALVGAKFAILPEYPSERNIKGQVPAQRQTSLWRKCEPAPRPAKYQQKRAPTAKVEAQDCSCEAQSAQEVLRARWARAACYRFVARFRQQSGAALTFQSQRNHAQRRLLRCNVAQI